MALNFPNKKTKITTTTERQIKQKSSSKTTNMAKANLGMDLEELINESNEYYLNNDFEVTYSTNDINFGTSIIYNNYELFAEKVTNGIKSL